MGKATHDTHSISEQMEDVGFFREVWQQIRLVFYLIRDRKVPIYLKAIPFLGILYALFPIDIIADIVPVLGQLDDITLLLIGAKVFIEMAPPDVVARYMTLMRSQATGTIIEGNASDILPDDVEYELKLIEGEIIEDRIS